MQSHGARKLPSTHIYIYITHQESGCANHPSWWQGQQLSTRKAFLPTYACRKIRELPPQTICRNAIQKSDFHHLSKTIRKCYNRCTVLMGNHSGPVIFFDPPNSPLPLRIWVGSSSPSSPQARLEHHQLSPELSPGMGRCRPTWRSILASFKQRHPLRR